MNQDDRTITAEDRQYPLDVIPAYKLYWMHDENIPTFVPDSGTEEYQTWFLEREE